MKVIFTATVGRSGSDFLSGAINRYACNVMAEHEPPNLLLARLSEWPPFRDKSWFAAQGRLGQLGRIWQRRYLFTDERLGRGKAFEWLEHGQHEKLRDVAAWKKRRIDRAERRGRDAYVEVSQFFIKTQAEYLIELFPNMGLIKLTRDPILAARSLANRDKELFDGGPPPDWRQNIFQIDNWSDLSRFQIFLHRWLETELRFERFVVKHEVAEVFRMATEDMTDPKSMRELFDYFGLKYGEIGEMRPTNTNLSQRNPATSISRADIEEFESLLALMPKDLRREIAYLHDYAPPALNEQTGSRVA